MSEFKKFLLSLDGGRKKEGVAEAIVRDVAKFLFFANKERVDWGQLALREKLHRFAPIVQLIFFQLTVYSYMEKCKGAGIKEEGQLSKLERLSLAIQYVERKGK